MFPNFRAVLMVLYTLLKFLPTVVKLDIPVLNRALNMV
jgi:hypothetical protein